MLLRKPKKIAYKLDKAGFAAQMDEFLASVGLEVADINRQLFATFVQHSSEDADSFDPELMYRRIRKAHVNRLAFYVLQPEREPKPEVTEAVVTTDDTVGAADEPKE